MATTRGRAQSEQPAAGKSMVEMEEHGLSLKKRASWKSWGRMSVPIRDESALDVPRPDVRSWTDAVSPLANHLPTPAQKSSVADVHLEQAVTQAPDELWIRLSNDSSPVQDAPQTPSKNGSRRSSEEKRTWRKPVPTLIPVELEPKVVSRPASVRSVKVQEVEVKREEEGESTGETASDGASLLTAMEHDSHNETVEEIKPAEEKETAVVVPDDTASEDDSDFDVPMPGSLSYPSSPRSTRLDLSSPLVTPPQTPTTARPPMISTDSYISTDSPAISTQDPSASDEDADSDLPLSALRSWPSPPSSPSNATPTGYESKRDRNTRRRRIKSEREKRRIERVEEQRLQESAAAEAEDLRIGTEIRERTLARRRSVRKVAAEKEKAEVAAGSGEFNSSQLSLSLAMVWRQSMDDLHAPPSTGSQFVEKFSSDEAIASQPESSDETPAVVEPVVAAPLSPSVKAPSSPIRSLSPVALVRSISRKRTVTPTAEVIVVAPQLFRRQSVDRVAPNGPQQWRSPYERQDEKTFAKKSQSTSALARLSNTGEGEGRSSLSSRASGLIARMSSTRRSGSAQPSPTIDEGPFLTARSPYSRERGELPDTSWSAIADDLSRTPPLPSTSSFSPDPSDYRRTQKDSISSTSTAPKRRSGMFLARFQRNNATSSSLGISDSESARQDRLKSAFSSDESGPDGKFGKKSKNRLSHRLGSALSQIINFSDRMAGVAPTAEVKQSGSSYGRK